MINQVVISVLDSNGLVHNIYPHYAFSKALAAAES
jgi:hypothetical protein